MNDMDWQEILICRSKSDPWARECRAQVKSLMPDYLTILEILTPGQREILSDYIAACEEYEHALTLLAYDLGKEHAASGN